MLVANMLYATSFGLLLVFEPDRFGPSRLFLSYWQKTTQADDDTTDELGVFVARIHRNFLLAFAASMFEMLLLDRTVQRLEWCRKCVGIYIALSVLPMTQGLLDESGYPDKKT
jgi:hypothetical protein